MVAGKDDQNGNGEHISRREMRAELKIVRYELRLWMTLLVLGVILRARPDAPVAVARFIGGVL